MAKPYKIPDFRKMYPEASEEVIAVLRTSERKMQYQEYDLKRARNIVDPKTGEKMTIPSREDSYERLQEMAVQFPEENRSVEDQILKKIECEQLHNRHGGRHCIDPVGKYMQRWTGIAYILSEPYLYISVFYDSLYA